MKISAINNYSSYATPLKPQSFKHTAVPYPEYRIIEQQTKNGLGVISGFEKLLSSIFHPEVTKEAVKIQKQLDTIFADNQHPKKAIYALV